MQTVAVIPVLHHGVVQFGSYLTITENMGFVNDVVSLVLATRINYSSLIISNEIQNETPFQDLDQFMNGETKAEVIPSNSYIWTNQHSSLHNNDYEDAHTQPQSGDDLFDILGADLKNELLNNYWEKNSRKNLGASSETYSTNQENAESGIFSLNGTDNLLDAVVTKVQPSYNKHSMDDNVSCRTTLTDHTSTSSRPCGRAAPSSTSRNDLSQSSCVYDSWTNKGHNTNQNKSKTNRKRLKPGENPKPRPKDRQMIQDRVKELREIVPNGAKCSIDAPPERTIKHMLFLQSVTKHSDKLKQCPDSKIMKGGGGGTTWAYEIGSQSLVCPIIVEDLPQPRQMLIEMICEERGSFLEIADILRGLGLTILKGLVETKNKKILARFAVEEKDWSEGLRLLGAISGYNLTIIIKKSENLEKKSFFLSGWLWLKDLLSKAFAKIEEIAKQTKKIAEDDPRRLIHSFKVGLALTLVSLFYYFQPLYSSFGVSAMWAVMTVIVVFEFSVGATLGKGLNRGLATLAAGVLAVGAHYLANVTGKTSEPIVIGLFVFIQAVVSTFIRFFPYVKARYDYGMLIFNLTFCLISISGLRTDETLELAQKRLLTIVIGASTCVVVSIFVYPVRAGEDLHKLTAKNIDKLGSFLDGFADECCRTSEDGK